MLDKVIIDMLIEGTVATLYMTLVSTLFGYIFGLPMGIVLAVTDQEGIKPNGIIYKILDFIVNLMRSIPFLILLILVMPVTRAREPLPSSGRCFWPRPEPLCWWA